MARDIIINGESLVKVKLGGHWSGRVSGLQELGLTTEQIRVTPKFYHHDIHLDDFGQQVPVEVMCQLAEVNIHMNLIHYDNNILQICVGEALGGGNAGALPFNQGTMRGNGALLGNRLPMFSSGNYLISLNVLSPIFNNPWRFRACYLNSQPLEIPLGTQATILQCNWRCIPYVPRTRISGTAYQSGQASIVEPSSSGMILWDSTLDT